MHDDNNRITDGGDDNDEPSNNKALLANVSKALNFCDYYSGDREYHSFRYY